MKFKLDENFGSRTQILFQQLGHDVHTVREENLEGRDDVLLYDICCEEQRCLVTLDLDFSDVIRFPPNKSNGIVVIRVPHNPSLLLLEKLVRQFLNELSVYPLEKNLWIVEIGRIRFHQKNADDN